jgi:hypothetical protein
VSHVPGGRFTAFDKQSIDQKSNRLINGTNSGKEYAYTLQITLWWKRLMKRTSRYVHRSMKASILKTLMGQFDFGGEISEI